MVLLVQVGHVYEEVRKGVTQSTSPPADASTESSGVKTDDYSLVAACSHSPVSKSPQPTGDRENNLDLSLN